MKNIYIIGAGAIGKTLAVLLKEKGLEVVFLKRKFDPDINVNNKIVLQIGEERIINQSIKSHLISDMPVLDGIVVLTTKAYGNIEISNLLKEKIGASPLVILQNGLGVEDPFINSIYSSVYRCVLFATCQMVNINTVKYKPISISQVGIVNGNQNELTSIVSYLNTSDFNFESNSEIEKIIWTKTIANCVFNSVCPLLEVDNGIFWRDSSALELAKKIILECVCVADAYAVSLIYEDIVNVVLKISKSSDGQLISTYQDILAKRETEIASLNMAVFHAASKIQLDNLVPITRSLGELIQLKSKFLINS